MALRSLKSRLARGLAITALVALGLDQLVQHALIRDGYLFGRRIAPFDPPLFAPFQTDRVDEYGAVLAGKPRPGPARESDFDPELGWCPRPGSGGQDYLYDERGARIGSTPVPRERTRGVQRVVALGCSFTFGAEVKADEAWVARVDAARTDLEIVNFGFGAYGLDQVLLRWRRDGTREHPDEVWLGVFPGAAQRNLTCWLPALRHWSQVVHFKPRFVLDENGGLVLVPCPVHSLLDLVQTIGDQQRFLAAARSDHWVQRASAAYAASGDSWMHHFATTRLALTIAERSGRDAREDLLDPSSETSRLEIALILQLALEVKASGARFRCIFLPDRGDLTDAHARGRPYWRDVERALAEAQIEIIDVTDELMAANALADDRLWAPAGHYSAAGSRIVAEAIEHGLVR